MSPSSQQIVSESADVVGRMLDQLCELMPEFRQDEAKRLHIEAQLRKEFGGQQVYVASGKSYEAVRQQVLRRFNGRNASTLAREYGIGRATVYRWLKQPGVQK